MQKRYITRSIEDLCFSDHTMAFVSGPRQCGKTTLGNMLLEKRKVGKYCNWDDITFRKSWTKDPSSIIPSFSGKSTPLLILDEIHKHRRWKGTLKGVYDTLSAPCDILVTGSARLSIYRKGGDSLLGRYHNFRLHPFSLREMHTDKHHSAVTLIDRLFAGSQRIPSDSQDNLNSLMKLGPFPKPLLSQNARKARIWQRERRELIIREDLRDLSKLPELDRVEMMAALLPGKVGSTFSLNSLREDLEIGHHTARRWLTYLKELFYIYEIKPYHKSIPRALKKEGKIYFWDFTEVDSPASRFENLVANHLLKACHYWTDSGEGLFELFFLRNKEKQEIDFLITLDKKPWLPVEVKSTDTDLSPNWSKFMPLIECKRGLQIVMKSHWKKHKIRSGEILVAGADKALDYFI